MPLPNFVASNRLTSKTSYWMVKLLTETTARRSFPKWLSQTYFGTIAWLHHEVSEPTNRTMLVKCRLPWSLAYTPNWYFCCWKRDHRLLFSSRHRSTVTDGVCCLISIRRSSPLSRTVRCSPCGYLSATLCHYIIPAMNVRSRQIFWRNLLWHLFHKSAVCHYSMYLACWHRYTLSWK
jgi:hypothetical protein